MSSDYEYDVLEIAGSGEIIRVTAGEAITSRDLVYLNADGNYYIADASAAATMPVVGIALHNSAANFPVTLLIKGYVGDVTTPWAWTTGSELYASDTAGAMGHAAGTVSQQVGMAISATQIFFDTKVAAGAVGAITIRRNSGADIGTRPRLNLIEGDATYLTVVPVDDAVGNEVDITFNPLGIGARERPAAIVGTRNVLNFIEGANITITVADNVPNAEIDLTIAAGGVAGGFTEFTYIVTEAAGTYSVYNNQGAVVGVPGVDADVQINWALTNGGAGAVVELEPDTTFVIDDPITFTANNQILQGGGRGSFIDGDTLATTEHGIVLSGFDDCQIRNLSIQTQDGGAKTCHCIFIEDGSDRFLIEDVWIVESDDNGIHIEGTTIGSGHIHRCYVLGADGNGIYVDMDAANFMLGLYISDCDITACGSAGINIQPSGGTTATIADSVIYTNGAEGIYVADGDHSIIDGCTLYDNTTDGIEINSSDHVIVSNNICQSNIQHGIYLIASTEAIIEGNVCEDNDYNDTASFDGINLADTSPRCVVTGNHCVANHRYGIYTEGVNTNVNGNYVNENDRHGIASYGAETLISGNYVYDNGQDTVGTYHGIYLGGAADRHIVIGNYCNDPGDTQEDGIHLTVGATNCSLIGNYCYNLLGDGIHLAGTNTKTLIEANNCFTNDENGIIVIDSVDCNVNGNHCSVNTFHGILLDNADSTSVTGNTCVGNDALASATYDGIAVDADSANNMITANKCDDNGRYGISIAGTTNRVKENEFDGNTTAAFNDTGTDTQTPLIYCRVTDPNDNIGTHPAVRLEDNVDTDIYDQIYFPLEFQQLVTAQVIVITAATGDMVWTLDTNWGKLCASEDYNVDTDTDGGTDTLTINDLECVDIAPGFTNIAPGDLVGVNFMRDGDDGADTIGDVVYYMGIRVRYV